MSEMNATRLMGFLQDNTLREVQFEIGDHNFSLMKSRFDDETDFLYLLDEFRHSPYTIGGSAKYSGVYSYRTGMLFDLCYALHWNMSGIEHTSHAEWFDSISRRVNNEIMRMVSNGKIEVTAAAEEPWNGMEYFVKYRLEEEAMQCFYSGNKPTYAPHFKIEHMSADEFVRSINHTDEAIEKYASEFVLQNALHIIQRLQQIPMVLGRLEELESTPGEHHIRRRIIRSIHDEKMVRAVIEKDGQQMEIRIKGSTLKNTDRYSYYTYSMDAPSRNEFLKLYGKNAELWPQDIVSISYGKKTLYHKAMSESDSMAS